MITIKDGRYFAKLWFCDGAEGDFLAALYRDPEQPFQLIYRFRHHVDNLIFESQDSKSWYSAVLEDTEENGVKAVDDLVAHLVATGFSRPQDAVSVVLKSSDAKANSHALMTSKIPVFTRETDPNMV